MVNGNAATKSQTKTWINCPLCGSPTLLNLWPSKVAGVWSCTNKACGASDTCEHKNTEMETHLDYRPTQEQVDLGTDQDELIEVKVCQDCGCGVDY